MEDLWALSRSSRGPMLPRLHQPTLTGFEGLILELPVHETAGNELGEALMEERDWHSGETLSPWDIGHPFLSKEESPQFSPN